MRLIKRWSHIINFILGVLLLGSVIFSIYQIKPFLTSKSNYRKLAKQFDRSQWRNPLSKEKIDDNTLYHYAAFYLVKGGNPFVVNPEVPPWGKYFYGLSIILFGNPYWASTFFYLGLIAVSIFLTINLNQSANKKNQFSKIIVALLVGLVVTNMELVRSQLHLTMLDLPLIFFLLLHIFFNLRSINHAKQSTKDVIISGLALGFFAGTKFPLFVPLVILADGYLFGIKKQWRKFIIILAVASFTFLSAYWRFLIIDFNFGQLIKNLIWTVNFYHASKVPLVAAQLFPTILLQQYFSPTHHAAVQAKHWDFTWPLIFGLFGLKLWQQCWQTMKNKLINSKNNYLKDYFLILIIGLIILLSLVNFWQRYLLIILPLMLIYLVVPD